MGKITVELIPKTCSYSNLRTLIPNKYWDKLRKMSYSEANHVCQVCGDSGKNQGYRHNVECHEIWGYDDKKKIQILLGLTSLCPMCHQVKHFGRASAIGKQAEVLHHMEKINNWSHKECVTHIGKIMMEYLERSKYKWRLSLELLNTFDFIPKSIISKAEKKRF
jgi:hypothetical protein